jgi:hypothetical protein
MLLVDAATRGAPSASRLIETSAGLARLFKSPTLAQPNFFAFFC